MTFPFSRGLASRVWAPVDPGSWSPTVKNGSWTITGDTVVLAAGGYSNIRWDRPMTSGKWYWEYYMNRIFTGSGYARFAGGIVDSTWAGNPTGTFGVDTHGWSVDAYRARLYHNGTATSLSISTGGDAGIRSGASMYCALDLDAGKMWFGWSTLGWDGNPAAGTGPTITGLSGTFYPAAYLYDVDDSVTLIKAASDVSGPIPSGFNAFS